VRGFVHPPPLRNNQPQLARGHRRPDDEPSASHKGGSPATQALRWMRDDQAARSRRCSPSDSRCQITMLRRSGGRIRDRIDPALHSVLPLRHEGAKRREALVRIAAPLRAMTRHAGTPGEAFRAPSGALHHRKGYRGGARPSALHRGHVLRRTGRSTGRSARQGPETLRSPGSGVTSPARRSRSPLRLRDVYRSTPCAERGWRYTKHIRS
jgi:hypothetical protein